MRSLLLLVFCAISSAQITTNNVNPNSKQGSGTKFQLSTGFTGSAGSLVCSDANGNTTTSGCSAAVTSFNGRTGAVSPLIGDYTWSLIGGSKQGTTNVPQMAGTNNGVLGAGLCNDATGNATTVGCTTGASGVASFNGRTGAVSPLLGDYTWSLISGTKQGNTNVPQMAGTNSGTSGALLCNDGSGNATTSGCSAGTTIPSGSQVQYLRIAPNTGNSTTLQFSTFTVTNSENFNFPPQTPGGTLNAGVPATVTMVPGPLGLSGAHTVAAHLPHKIRLFGGAGTEETAFITGGTCTGNGVTTCTVTFTPANSHSAAWQIGPASDGVQEAIYASAVSDISGVTGTVRMPTGSVFIRGTVYVPDNYRMSLRGQSMASTVLRTTFPDGDVIVYDYFNSGAAIDLGDFSIIDNAGANRISGAMIHVRYRTDGLVSNIFCAGGFDCYEMERNARALWTNLNGYATHYGIWVTCAGVAYPTCANEGRIEGGHIVANSNLAQPVRIESPTSGLKVTKLFTEGSSFSCVSLVLVAVGGDPFNELMIQDNIFDGCQVGLDYVGNGSTYVSNYVLVQGNEFNVGNPAFGPNTGIICQAFCQNLFLQDNIIGAAGGSAGDRGIILGGDARHIVIANNRQLGADGDYSILLQGITSDITIQGNNFATAAASNYCLGMGGTVTGLNVKGNQGFENCTTGTVNNGATVTGWLMKDNTGIDNVVPTVASGATVNIPYNPTFILTGTTGVTTAPFQLADGSKFTFIATNAAPGAWTAGATIGNTFTPTQNRPVNCVMVAGKVSCTP